MSAYEALKGDMDAQVDAHLGDSIIYRVDGVALESEPGAGTIPGFVSLDPPPNDFSGAVPARERWTVKIRKQFLPAGGPNVSHRIQHPKVGPGAYRPAADTVDEQGDYWIFELGRAPA